MTTNRINNNPGGLNGSTPLSPLTPKAADAAKAAVAGAAGTGVPTGGKSDAGKAANYDVQISSGAKSRAEAFNKALDIARNTPDVREDRVASLKKQIQDGTYKVDSGNIADGMLREAIKEHLSNKESR